MGLKDLQLVEGWKDISRILHPPTTKSEGCEGQEDLEVSRLQKVECSISVAKSSGKVRNGSREVSRGKVLRLHTVFRVLTQSEDLVSSLLSIYSSTCG